MATQVSEVVLKGLHEITQKITPGEDTDYVVVIEDLNGTPTVKIISRALFFDSFGDDLDAIDAALLLKADKTNVLELDNTSPYTPTLDYHPATLKALQDAVIAAGAGDVVGPGSSVNNRIAVFDGLTGKLIADSGILMTEMARVGGINLWQKAQSFGEYVLDENLYILWDMQENPCASVTLSLDGNTVSPSNFSAGTTYVLRVIQDASGGNDLFWTSQFEWSNGTRPTLTKTPNAVDIFTFYSDGNSIYGTRTPNFS